MFHNTQYLDLLDKPIDNPQAEIKKLNAKKYLPTQKRIKLDYQGHFAAANIGFAELWGERDKQEDSIAIGLFDDIDTSSLSDDDFRDVMQATVKSLEAYVEEKNMKGGSTLCSVLMHANRIITTNLGDSAAYICVLNENGTVDRFERLNTTLHNPSDESEKNRIEQEKNYKCSDKLVCKDEGKNVSSYLYLSRSIGDLKFATLGLSHHPDFYRFIIKTPVERKRIFIIVACDGLTDNNCLDDNKIAQIISDNHDKPHHIIAKCLAQKAIEAGSNDNVSVCVTQLNLSSHMLKYISLFDGHFSDEVSTFLGESFDKTLRIHLQTLLLKQHLKKVTVNEHAKIKLQALSRYVESCCLNLNPLRYESFCFLFKIIATLASNNSNHSSSEIQCLANSFHEYTNIFMRIMEIFNKLHSSCQPSSDNENDVNWTFYEYYHARFHAEKNEIKLMESEVALTFKDCMSVDNLVTKISSILDSYAEKCLRASSILSFQFKRKIDEANAEIKTLSPVKQQAIMLPL